MANEKRLIDAKRLIRKILEDNSRADSTKNYFKVIVNRQPTVDAVEVVHGRWIWKDLHSDGSLTLCCSECLNTEGAGNANYCNYCGADMRGKE